MVMNFLSDGAHQWTVLHGGSSSDVCLYDCLEVDTSGNIFVGGYTSSTDLDGQSNAGGDDVMVMKFQGPTTTTTQTTVTLTTTTSHLSYSLTNHGHPP
ncbi:unnamed protein product [Cladocopium goreaui]|uniref:Ig-like domain-containing protein n=1 Tax=Cladocopium goreaui TaxID=2562237 RepID=A0A9P1FRK8_9DINO|nr:unnamed protein product [Cladocopium goreaui]